MEAPEFLIPPPCADTAEVTRTPVNNRQFTSKVRFLIIMFLNLKSKLINKKSFWQLFLLQVFMFSLTK